MGGRTATCLWSTVSAFHALHVFLPRWLRGCVRILGAGAGRWVPAVLLGTSVSALSEFSW